MEGGVQLREGDHVARAQEYTYHIPRCIQLRAERGRPRGQEGLATSRSPAARPQANQACPSHGPSVLPATELSRCQYGRSKTALGSDTPRLALPRSEAIKGLAIVAGARTGRAMG